MTIRTQMTGQFDGYTLTNLRALTLRYLRVGNTTRYSPTAGTADYDWIDDALNRGQEDFVRRTRCLRTFAVIELVANYRTYRLPWNFIDFMAAYFYTSNTDYDELTVETIEGLNDQDSDWRTTTGDPTHIYIDRVYGNVWTFGLYPIPDTDGETIVFDSEYGAVVQWVCPIYTMNQEYGVVVRMTDTDEFYLNTDLGVVGQAQTTTGNIWMEYYRLPEKLILNTENLGDQGTQYPEIPREYHKSLAYFAAADLLANNPEDSMEFKRAGVFDQKFEREVQTYIDERKRPMAGRNLRARAVVWSKLDNMQYFAEMP
ncbi:MAG: phage adaptor protein [Candidatus Thorarchaeota archaeon]|jgi:hypothetical protein